MVNTSNWTRGDWDTYMAKVSILEGTATNMKSALQRVGASKQQINSASATPVEGVIFNNHYVKDWKTNKAVQEDIKKNYSYCPKGGTCLWMAMETTQNLIEVWEKFFPHKSIPSDVRYWNGIIANQRNTNGLLHSFGVTVTQAQNIYPPSTLSNCTSDSFKRNLKKTYTASDSVTLAEYEKNNHVSGVSLDVDYNTVLGFQYYGTTIPNGLAYLSQIAVFLNGATMNRVNTDTLEHGQCLKEGYYWVKYGAKFNKGTSTIKKTTLPKCTLDSFKHNSTETYTSANSSTIKQYEQLNNVSGVTLRVDHNIVISAIPMGDKYPSGLTYESQLNNWKRGKSENRVHATGCTPTGYYWVAYGAKFTVPSTKQKKTQSTTTEQCVYNNCVKGFYNKSFTIKVKGIPFNVYVTEDILSVIGSYGTKPSAMPIDKQILEWHSGRMYIRCLCNGSWHWVVLKAKLTSEETSMLIPAILGLAGVAVLYSKFRRR